MIRATLAWTIGRNLFVTHRQLGAPVERWAFLSARVASSTCRRQGYQQVDTRNIPFAIRSIWKESIN